MLTNMFYVHVLIVLIFALSVSYSDHWDTPFDHKDGLSDHKGAYSDHKDGYFDHNDGYFDHNDGQSVQKDGQSNHKDGQSNILQQFKDRIKALEEENLVILPALKMLTQELQYQKEKLTEQESIIKNLSSVLDVQASMLLQKDKTITSFQNNIENLQATLRTKEANEEELKSEIKIQGNLIKALTEIEVENKEFTEAVLHYKEELHTNMEPELLTSETEADINIINFQDKHPIPELGQLSLRRNKNNSKKYRPTNSDQNIPSNRALIRENKENIHQRNAVDGPVAFHARIDLDSHSHLGVNQIIKFDDELLDLGDGYHSTTGIFNTPIKGIYLFSVSLGTWFDDKANFNAVIVKNGNWIAAITGHGGENVHQLNQGSVTVAMQLDTGDEVWVKNAHTTDAAIAGWGYSTFTGILIKQL